MRLTTAFSIMSSIFATSSGLVWRDILMVLGIILPILVTIFLYLVKRNLHEVAEHRKTELKGIQKELEGIQTGLSNLGTRIDRVDGLGVSHQDRCSEKYVTIKQHEREIALLREQISTITNNTRITTDVMDSVFRLAEKLSRRPPSGGSGEH